MKSQGIRVGGGRTTGVRFAFGSLLVTGVILLAGCSSAASTHASAAGVPELGAVPAATAAPAAMAAPSTASRDSAFGSLQNAADASGSIATGGGRCPTSASADRADRPARPPGGGPRCSDQRRRTRVAAVGGTLPSRSGAATRPGQRERRFPGAGGALDRRAGRAAAVGTKVLGEQTSSQEVTAQVVDLGARLANLRVTETALQGIMDRATKIPDVLAVQAQLTDVRGQIEELTAEQQTLQNQAALATLTVTFRAAPGSRGHPGARGLGPRQRDRPGERDPRRARSGLAGAGIWLLIVGLPVLLVVGVLG